ncbi:MAG TPA: xylulokinase [Candidatus Nanopelagicales bacterium]
MSSRELVAGVDSSTQACKVVIRSAAAGELVRQGRAPHPDGTEVDPQSWWNAFLQAVDAAGGLDDVGAIGVASQQHGMVLLDDSGATVRDALLWNDVRSAPQARDLVAELGGDVWAAAVGSVPVASFTVTKLRWSAECEPLVAARASAVCLPHDWLTWRLVGGGAGSSGPPLPSTDRGDASGTGYFSPASGTYRFDLLSRAFGRALEVPEVLAPGDSAGVVRAQAPGLKQGAVVSAGTGDNMAAALALALEPGDVVVSVGTSGTAFAVREGVAADVSGAVAGFCDATGRQLPLVATLNAARVLAAGARLLGVDFAGLDRLALSAPPGAEGLVMLPYFDGERTPDRPTATGALSGMTTANTTPANLARATVEGVLCGLADAVDALVACGVPVRRILLVGGGARSEAVRVLAPMLFAHPVVVPEPGEYVADGAARQAHWAWTGQLPDWPSPAARAPTYDAAATPAVRAAYAAVRG